MTQVMLPVSVADDEFVAVTVAVLFIVVQTDVVVDVVTDALNVALGASDPTVQVSVCAPVAPVTVQPAVLVDQTSCTAGSASVITTPVAAPVPTLPTRIVNVAVDPGVTIWPFGLFVMVSCGVETQVIDPLSCADEAFDADTVAVLFITAQAPALVTALTAAVEEAP